MPSSLSMAAAVVSLLVTAATAATSRTDLLAFPDCVHGPLANNTVCNPKAAPAARAAALVKAMTIDEKLVNLVKYVVHPFLPFVLVQRP